jgi:BlaI family transcriptional regulator, penicillinase repressor
MLNASKTRRKPLSELEHLFMEYLWAHGTATAEAVREGLAKKKPLKDSTIRTILRRLEEKGYLRHSVEGRTFIYRVVEEPQSLAVRAVRQIIDRFCGGSVEQLLTGMVDNEVLDPGELRRLAQKITAAKGKGDEK